MCHVEDTLRQTLDNDEEQPTILLGRLWQLHFMYDKKLQHHNVPEENSIQ